jgi:hypothetical protein
VPTSFQIVDLLIEHQLTILPIEVKATAKPTCRDARHLLPFRAEYGRRVLGGLLLHGGRGDVLAGRGYP